MGHSLVVLETPKTVLEKTKADSLKNATKNRQKQADRKNRLFSQKEQ